MCKRVRTGRIPFLLVIMLFFFASPCFSAEGRSRNLHPQQILLISPFNVSFVQDFQMCASFQDRLNLSGESYLLNRFDLDLHNGKCTPEKLAEFESIAKEIGKGKYRVVVCFGIPSLNLIKEHMKDIPENVSVLVCGISNLDRDQLPPQFGGVIQQVNLVHDLQVIRTLFPEKKKIILLTNWHETGQRIRAAAQDAIRQFPDLTLIDFDNNALSTEEMLKQVNAESSDAVVLFQGWYNKNAVNAASLQLLMDNLGNKADVPLFVMHSAMLRFGTVGGCVEDGKATGRAAAELALQVLADGKTPPIRTLPAPAILNDSLLRFYAIPDSRLPDHAKILGRYKSFYAHNKELICAVSGVIALIVVMAAISLFFAVRFRRLIQQMKTIFAHLPVNVAVIDESENVLLYYGNTEAPGVDREHVRKMKDFSLDVYPFFQDVIHKVLNDRQPRHQEYVKGGLHRRGDCVYLPREVFGRPSALWASVDINLLVALSENEKLLNRCLAAAMSDSNVEAAFPTILEMICEHFKGDRCYLLHYDFEQELIVPVNEYCAAGNKPYISLMSPLHLPRNEEWFQKLYEHNWVDYDVEAAADVDQDKGIWASCIRQIGVKRLYTMPIFFHGKLWGNWGVTFEKQNVALPENSLQLISSIGHMLGLVLLRQRYIAELSRARDQAEAKFYRDRSAPGRFSSDRLPVWKNREYR